LSVEFDEPRLVERLQNVPSKHSRVRVLGPGDEIFNRHGLAWVRVQQHKSHLGVAKGRVEDPLLAKDLPDLRQLPLCDGIAERLCLFERGAVIDPDEFTHAPISKADSGGRVNFIGVYVSAFVAESALVSERVKEVEGSRHYDS